MDANRYTTAMNGIKYKIAHKRSGYENWNISERAQKRRLILLLEKFVTQLKEEEDVEKKSTLRETQKARRTAVA